MISVTIQRKNGKIIFFEVSGHSGYAKTGKDIVCASVSSVVWTVINGIENVISAPIQYKEHDGFVSCSLLNLSDDYLKKSQVLLESMVLFLKEFSKQYSDFISISEV